MNFQKIKTFDFWINAGVFFFVAAALILPSGYSLGALVLLLMALIYLGFNWKNLKSSPKFIIYTFLIYFLARFISFAYFDFDESIQLDLASKVLLIIPIIILLSQKQLNFKFMVVGIALGIGLAFLYAFYQVHFLKSTDRAINFFHNPIMFGQTGVLWGMLSLCGFFLLDKITGLKNKLIFSLILLLGFAFGVGVAVLSGSKGAWIMILPALIVFSLSSWKYLKLKHFVAIFAIFVLLLAWVFGTNNIVKTRTLEAVNEIKIYTANQGLGDYTSVGTRLQMYKIGFDIFKEYPIMGAGRMNRQEVITKLDISPAIKHNVIRYERLHNDFLDASAFYGLFVLIPFLAFLIIPAWYFGKNMFTKDAKIKYLAMSGFLVVFCDLMAAMTETYFQSNSGLVTYSLLVAIFASQLWQIQKNNLSKQEIE